MEKFFKLLKSSGALVIYFWLATTFVGVLSLFVAPSLMNSVTVSDSEMYISIGLINWFGEPLPKIVFIVMIIIAILITLAWLKSKFKK